MTELDQRVARVEALLTELCAQRAPEAERITREILGTVLELHRHALARILELTPSESHAVLARDPSIAALLVLHDLHPVSAESRARAAVSALRARFSTEITSAELSQRDGALELRVVPKPGVRQSTRASLKQACESALLEAAPDLESIHVHVSEPPPVLVQLRRGAAR